MTSMKDKTHEELVEIIRMADEARDEIHRRYAINYEDCHRRQLVAEAEYRAAEIATGSCWICGNGTPHEHDAATINMARVTQEGRKA